MKRILLTAVMLIFARVTAASAILAPLEPPHWTISVDAWIDKTHLRYETVAWVYKPGPSYRMTLYGIGQLSQSTALHIVDRFDVILGRERSSTVFNAGYWGSDPFDPAGLLLVDGVTYHKFSFARNPKSGDYKLSAVVCLDKHGQVRLLNTDGFDSPTESIKDSCFSAVQTGPILLHRGDNKIRPTEVTRGQEKFVLTVLGLDAHNAPYVVVFQSPVNLYVAAEFLRGVSSRSGHVTITGNGTIHASGGPGLLEAVDLGGGDGAACYAAGRRVIGNSLVAMPSAFTLGPP